MMRGAVAARRAARRANITADGTHGFTGGSCRQSRASPRALRTRYLSVRYCSAQRIGSQAGRGRTRGCWITSPLTNCPRVKVDLGSVTQQIPVVHAWRLPSLYSTSAISSSPPSRSWIASAVDPHWPRDGLAADQSSASTGTQVSRAQAARIAASRPSRITSAPYTMLPRAGDTATALKPGAAHLSSLAARWRTFPQERLGGMSGRPFGRHARLLSSQTLTSRSRCADAGRQALARGSLQGAGHAAIGTQVAPRPRSAGPARMHVLP
jgi:hypothetical protein